MSSNVEIVKGAYDALAKGDVDSIIQVYRDLASLF